MTRIFWVFMVWLLGIVPVLAQSVPDGVLKRMKSDPQAYLDLAADLIHGFGSAQGIDRAGIARFVALERANARADGLRRLYLADLNFDNVVNRDELAQVAAAASAYGRGRIWKVFESADRDSSGVVEQTEIAAFGTAEALRLFSAADEAEVMSVLAFDADANGWIDLAEVKAAVAALGI